MILARRSFLTGLGAALITAPAIVRAGSLMPVKQMLADNVALSSNPHPCSNLVAVGRDLTEDSLLELMMEIRSAARGLHIRPRYIVVP